MTIDDLLRVTRQGDLHPKILAEALDSYRRSNSATVPPVACNLKLPITAGCLIRGQVDREIRSLLTLREVEHTLEEFRGWSRRPSGTWSAHRCR